MKITLNLINEFLEYNYKNARTINTVFTKLNNIRLNTNHTEKDILTYINEMKNKGSRRNYMSCFLLYKNYILTVNNK